MKMLFTEFEVNLSLPNEVFLFFPNRKELSYKDTGIFIFKILGFDSALWLPELLGMVKRIEISIC